MTLGEIRKGIEGAPDAQRRQVLADWLETDMPLFFTGRILLVDAPVTDRWGRRVGNAGRPLPAIDSLLAATVIVHDLVLVTRNTKDFAGLSVQLFNPWTDKHNKCLSGFACPPVWACQQAALSPILESVIPDAMNLPPSGANTAKANAAITGMGVADWVNSEVRIYERLLLKAQLYAGGKDFIEGLNPNSLKIVTAIVET